MVEKKKDSIIPSFLDTALGFNLNRVNTLFRRELLRVLSPFNLTPEQWQVLVILWHRNEALSQNDIVASILKDKPSVSRMLLRMEKNGWIYRRSDPNDKRSTLVSLTEKGAEHEVILPAKVKEHFNDYLDGFSNEEKVQLKTVLMSLRAFLHDR